MSDKPRIPQVLELILNSPFKRELVEMLSDQKSIDKVNDLVHNFYKDARTRNTSVIEMTFTLTLLNYMTLNQIDANVHNKNFVDFCKMIVKELGANQGFEQVLALAPNIFAVSPNPKTNDSIESSSEFDFSKLENFLNQDQN